MISTLSERASFLIKLRFNTFDLIQGKLARRLRWVAEEETIPGLKFKVAERGGKTVGGQLQKTNFTGSSGCQEVKCPVCQQPGGGSGRCRKSNITYKYVCNKCSATYIGETSRNLYTRGLEHQDKFEKRKPDSFMYNHQEEHHPGDQPDYNVSVVQRPTVSAGSRGSPHNEVQRRNIEQQIRVQTVKE